MYWQQIQHNLTLKEPGHLHILYGVSENLVEPVESILHWSDGLVHVG